MAAFLRRHAYRGGKTPTELRERLSYGPAPPTGLPPRVLAHLLGVQIQLLRTLLDTITALETQIKRIIATHPRAHLLHQLPRDRPDQPGPGPRRNRPRPRTASPTPNKPLPNAEPHPSPNHPAKPPASTSAGTPTPAPARPPTAFAHHSRRQSRWAQGLYRDARAPRQTQPPRHPHRGPLLDPRHLGLLAHQHPLRPPQIAREMYQIITSPPEAEPSGA